MSFFSTRGGSCVTASQAILNGLAPDGGLYVPAMFPPVSKEKLTSLAGMSYCERASAILRTYLEDFSIPEIDAALANAYGAEKFDAPEIAPLRRLDEQTYVMELFHGPTLAFKDMALQLLPHLITLSARKTVRSGRSAFWWPPAATREKRPWRASRMFPAPAARCSIPWRASAGCRSCKW